MKINWKFHLKRFSGIRVLVIGDVMLDQYIMGRVSRVSPEAPVPVVDVQSEKFFPGGASNVARNLRSLTAKVAVLGVVGRDSAGATLDKMLKHQGIETSHLIRDSRRPTVLKTRVIAHHQQVVRFDRESRAPLHPALATKALASARKLIPRVDLVLFEDYAKGLMEQKFLDECVHIAKKCGVPTFLDPNLHHRLDYHDLTGITPNRGEAFWVAHEVVTEPWDDPLKDKRLLEVGRKILEDHQIENVLITLSEHGMCLFRKGHKPHHIPTAAVEVSDVSGAGDTAISVFALAYASGLDAVAAAHLANQASGIVVGKAGTATVTIEELMRRL